MRRSLIVFLFLFIPFFSFPAASFAQPATDSASATQQEPSLWTQFWNWVFGIFIKNDYLIVQRDSSTIISDMTSYGLADDDTKHSSPGTRLTDLNSQVCYKGTVIKKVILDESGYPNSDLAKVCPEPTTGCTVTQDSTDPSCEQVSIKNIAVYLVQTNQKFYCNDNKLIDTPGDIISAVNSFISDNNLSPISSINLPCYQKIYKDLYLVPKDTSNNEEENTKKIIQTPISADDQNQSADNNDIKKQLDSNFSPQGSSAGLKGLRPISW